jgi:hypothetical protein
MTDHFFACQKSLISGARLSGSSSLCCINATCSLVAAAVAGGCHVEAVRVVCFVSLLNVFSQIRYQAPSSTRQSSKTDQPNMFLFKKKIKKNADGNSCSECMCLSTVYARNVKGNE